MKGDLYICSWDRLLGFLRQRYPRLGRYGGDTGGHSNKLIACMKDDLLLERVAAELNKIDARYHATIRPAVQIFEKAAKDRADSERALLETLPN